MNYFCDINIGDIKIIIKKTEKNNFVFRNHSRARSGFVCFLTGEGSLEIDGVGTYHIEPGSFFRYEAGDRYFINVPTPCEYYVSEIDIGINDENAFPRSILCTKDEIALLENIHRIWNEQNEYCYMETRILLLRFFMNVSRRIRAIMSSPRFISDALSFTDSIMKIFPLLISHLPAMSVHPISAISFVRNIISRSCNIARNFEFPARKRCLKAENIRSKKFPIFSDIVMFIIFLISSSWRQDSPPSSIFNPIFKTVYNLQKSSMIYRTLFS